MSPIDEDLYIDKTIWLRPVWSVPLAVLGGGEGALERTITVANPENGEGISVQLDRPRFDNATVSAHFTEGTGNSLYVTRSEMINYNNASAHIASEVVFDAPGQVLFGTTRSPPQASASSVPPVSAPGTPASWSGATDSTATRNPTSARAESR